MKHLSYLMILRYIAGLILAAAMVFGCASVKNGAEAYYEGAAMGYRGMIRVRVGMGKGTITEIAVTESREDRAVGGAAIEELTDLVLMYNTTELDAISGATATSKGFLAALEDAIMFP
jgi:uncharacterized protein with FMN-binding domain